MSGTRLMHTAIFSVLLQVKGLLRKVIDAGAKWCRDPGAGALPANGYAVGRVTAPGALFPRGAQEVEPHEPPAPVSDDIEVPEADALEQSQPVPMSEDEQ